jgi:hypothetical protein
MQVFLDDLTIYGITSNHLGLLEKRFKQCQEVGINLNPKNAFLVLNQGFCYDMWLARKACLWNPRR